MNEPLRIATTSRSFGLAAAISRASASVRSAIVCSSKRILTCLAPLMKEFGERPLIARLGEFYQNVANPGRGRRQPRPEGNALPGGKAGLGPPRRPDVKLAPVRAAQGQAERRHRRFPVAQVRDIARNQKLPLGVRLLGEVARTSAIARSRRLTGRPTPA